MAGTIDVGGVTLRYADDGTGSSIFRVASNLDNTRIDATYKIDSNWDARQDVLAALRGQCAYVHVGALSGPHLPYSSSGKGYITRTLPHLMPETFKHLFGPFAGTYRSWLYCTHAGYRGRTARENLTTPTLPGHADTLIDVQYEGLPYNVLPAADVARVSDGISWPVDESWFFKGEFKRWVSTPTPKEKTRVEWAKAGAWIWVDNGLLVTKGLPIIYKNFEYVMTWHQVPVANIPWKSILYLTGRSNEARFAQCDAETLVFDSPAFTGHRDLGGTRICDISYTFTWHPRGANYFPDPMRGFRFFEVVARDLSANKPYPPGNFRMLFRPEPEISD